jgi:hypothetical protein
LEAIDELTAQRNGGGSMSYAPDAVVGAVSLEVPV